jgi:hypothetical protein
MNSPRIAAVGATALVSLFWRPDISTAQTDEIQVYDAVSRRPT